MALRHSIDLGLETTHGVAAPHIIEPYSALNMMLEPDPEKRAKIAHIYADFCAGYWGRYAIDEAAPSFVFEALEWYRWLTDHVG
jgi:hypothetical protein